MAQEDILSNIIDPKVFEDFIKLNSQLDIAQQKFVDTAAAAIQMNNAIAGSKTFSQFTEAAQNAAAGVSNMATANEKLAVTQNAIKAQNESIVASIRNKITANNEEAAAIERLNGSITANAKLLIQQKLELADVEAKLKDLSKAYAGSKQSQDALINDTAKYKVQQAELKAAISETNATITLQSKINIAAEGSGKQLNLQLIELRNTYALLNEEERESSAGVALLANIEQLAVKTKELDAEQLVYNKNVGNYPQQQGKFAAAIERVTNLQNIGARVVSQFSRQIIGLGVGFLSFTIGAKAIEALIGWFEKLDVFTGRLDQLKQNLDALNDVMKNANKIAGDNIATLKVLYATTTDVSLSEKDRVAAAEELKKLYPDLLKNSSDASIMNGEEAKSIDKITEALIRQAKGEAALAKIKEIESQRLDLAFQRDKNNAAKADQLSKVTEGTEDEALASDRSGGGAVSAKDKRKVIKDQTDIANARIAEDDRVLAAKEAFLEKFIGLDNIAKAAEKEGPKDKKKKDTTLDDLLKDNEDKQELAKQALKKILDDENQSYDARIAALKLYYDREHALIEQETKLKLSKPDLTPQQKKNVRTEKDLNLGKLNQEQADDLKKIQDKELEDLRKQYEVEIGLAKDHDKKLIESQKAESEKKITQISQDFDKQQTDLAQQYSVGEISEKQYHQKLLEITHASVIARLNEEVKFLKALIAEKKASGQDTSADEKALADLEKKISDEVTKFKLDGYKTLGDAVTALRNLEVTALNDVLDATKTVVDGIINAQAERVKQQQDLLNRQVEAEKVAVENSVGTQKQKADRLALIDAQAQQKRDALQRKEAELKRRAAIVDKAANIAKITENTALSIIKTGADLGYPAAIPFQILAGAIGAIQLASVVATPLPQYAKGTQNAPEGFAIVGEHGTELRINPDGSRFLTPDVPTLTHLQAGTKIIPHQETLNIIKNQQLNYGSSTTSLAGMEKLQRETINAIKSSNQSHSGTYLTEKGLRGYTKSGISRTEYLKRNGIKN